MRRIGLYFQLLKLLTGIIKYLQQPSYERIFQRCHVFNDALPKAIRRAKRTNTRLCSPAPVGLILLGFHHFRHRSML